MLQRIQSLYTLGFISITLLYSLRFSIPFEVNSNTLQWILSYTPYLFAVLAFVSLFLFSKRKVQIRLNTFILLSSVGYEAFIITQVFEQFETLKESLLIHSALVFLSWIFLLLTNRYIKKDEALIRSVDRLR
ncbi:DUF4293 domain-containing protein [Flavobacteriaceae bacterium]|nr:DUF4293 domain-containing protein [Flavobacteriaceae bacterium]PTM01557.1 MAG: hypothetical protein DA394_03860 [Candidatus Arcticimaribacter sp.]